MIGLTMNDSGLLNCAHCDSVNVGVETDDDGWRYIECHDCMIRTDGYRNDRLMIKAWNKRGGWPYTEEDFKQAGMERE